MLFVMIVKARYKGMKIKEIPVFFVNRIYGESKLNLFIKMPKLFQKYFLSN